MKIRSLFAPLRVAARAFGFLGMVLLAVGICAALRLAGRERIRPVHAASWWSQRLLAMLNITVRIHGERLKGRGMVISNHVSWLDILVVAAAAEPHFVAKSDIADWPLVGWIAKSVETFFIRRGKGGSRPLLDQLVPWLRDGSESIAIFPEGTTTDGSDVLPMHPRLFSAAIEAQVPVQPVALQFHADQRGQSVAPFIGDDTLVAHILRVLASPGFAVDVHFGRLQSPNQSLSTLAWNSEQEVRRCLGLAPRSIGKAA